MFILKDQPLLSLIWNDESIFLFLVFIYFWKPASNGSSQVEFAAKCSFYFIFIEENKSSLMEQSSIKMSQNLLFKKQHFIKSFWVFFCSFCMNLWSLYEVFLWRRNKTFLWSVFFPAAGSSQHHINYCRSI